MECPICNQKVLNNSDYSVHMNTHHRGQKYNLLDYNDISGLELKKKKDLYRPKGKKDNESNNNNKTNVDSRMEKQKRA
jgi:hypothetical protein